MAKKLKFKPKITRVKLNPEQAVLVCDCYTGMTMKQESMAYWGAFIAGGGSACLMNFGRGHPVNTYRESGAMQPAICWHAVSGPSSS